MIEVKHKGQLIGFYINGIVKCSSSCLLPHGIWLPKSLLGCHPALWLPPTLPSGTITDCHDVYWPHSTQLDLAAGSKPAHKCTVAQYSGGSRSPRVRKRNRRQSKMMWNRLCQRNVDRDLSRCSTVVELIAGESILRPHYIMWYPAINKNSLLSKKIIEWISKTRNKN